MVMEKEQRMKNCVNPEFAHQMAIMLTMRMNGDQNERAKKLVAELQAW
mgnify:CR=1 FL=1